MNLRYLSSYSSTTLHSIRTAPRELQFRRFESQALIACFSPSRCLVAAHTKITRVASSILAHCRPLQRFLLLSRVIFSPYLVKSLHKFSSCGGRRRVSVKINDNASEVLFFHLYDDVMKRRASEWSFSSTRHSRGKSCMIAYKAKLIDVAFIERRNVKCTAG